MTLDPLPLGVGNVKFSELAGAPLTRGVGNLNLSELAGAASDRARHNIVANAVRVTNTLRREVSGVGIYIGFDGSAGSVGLHAFSKLGDRGDEVALGQFISNSGVAPGDKVFWTPGGIGGVYSLKVMPR
jgi:hypothetical protein